MSSASELKEITKEAIKRLREEARVQKASSEAYELEHCKQNLEKEWKMCEDVLWPKIQDNMLLYASRGESKYTYVVSYKDFPKDIQKNIYNANIHSLVRCLASFAREKGFETTRPDVWGHHNGQHVRISWR